MILTCKFKRLLLLINLCSMYTVTSCASLQSEYFFPVAVVCGYFSHKSIKLLDKWVVSKYTLVLRLSAWKRHRYPTVCSGGKYQQQRNSLLSKSICFQLLLIWNLIPTELLSEHTSITQAREAKLGKKKILCLYFRHHFFVGCAYVDIMRLQSKELLDFGYYMRYYCSTQLARLTEEL